MAYAVVHDIACSWQEYERVWRELLEPLPLGLLVHVAGPTDEGVRLIDIWAEDEPGVGVHADRLARLVTAVDGRAAEREFRPVHVVIDGRHDAVTEEHNRKDNVHAHK